jgi:hypothetical protein
MPIKHGPRVGPKTLGQRLGSDQANTLITRDLLHKKG